MEYVEATIAWPKRMLEEFETTTEVSIWVSNTTSIDEMFIPEALLALSPKLHRALFHGGHGGDTESEQEHIANIIDRLLSTAQRNPAIKFVAIYETEFRETTIINLLREKRGSLDTLFLFDSGHSIQSQSSFDAIANAMKECHSLTHIGLQELSEPFYVSILKNGLSSHPSLVTLQLSELRVTDESIAVAVQDVLQSSGPKLKSLTLHDCQFSHLILEPIVNGLLHHPTVESLMLEHCQFMDPGALPALLTLLQSNSNLRSLDLNQTQLDIDMLHEILSALYQNTSLRHLNLMECGLDDENSISHVQALLLHNETISRLNLSSNALGASGAAFLANRIQNLMEFECYNCSLEDEGIRALLPLPTEEDNHFKLQKLSLDGNDITHRGIHHLAEFLKHPSCRIHCLSLGVNPINAHGSRILADMLQADQRLTELSLDYCDLSLYGLKKILCSLQHNQTLEFLRLRKITGESDAGGDDDDVDDVFENSCNFLAVYNILSHFIPESQIRKLTLDLDFDSDYVDESTGSEFAVEEIDRGQDLLLVAFSQNTTIQEVKVSNKFFHPQRQKQLAFYTLRNKFQTFIESSADNNGNLTIVEDGGDPHLSLVPTVPRGLWAHILEAGHKRHHNASVLHHLLSSRLDLILAREE